MSIQTLVADPGHRLTTSNKMPEVSYTVLDKDDIFKYNSLSNKVARVAWLIASMLLFPMGLVCLIGKITNYFITKIVLLPALKHKLVTLDNERAKHLDNPIFAERCERLAIKTADHIKLDTMMVNNPDEEKKAFGDRKYIIFLNGNGGCYEHMLPTLMKISEETGTSVYCGNYRGIGRSEGFPTGYQDLVMDGEAMVQYLLTKGVKSENILIHGWSFGGAVGVHLAALHQEEGHEMNFGSDRSFASLSAILKERSRKLHRKFKRINIHLSKIKVKVLKVLTSLTNRLIFAFGWDFKCVKCYKAIKGHKFIIYHRDDYVIPYGASLYKKLKLSQMTQTHAQEKILRVMQKSDPKTAPISENKGNIDRSYRPAHIVRLSFPNNIHKTDSHSRFIDDTPEFDQYIAQVTLAFR